MRDCGLTDSGVRELADGLPELRSLNLECCTKVHTPDHGAWAPSVACLSVILSSRFGLILRFLDVTFSGVALLVLSLA